MRFLRLLMFTLLSSIVLWLGIIPAFRGLNTDFPSYYTASRLVVEGGDLHRLYDDDWFQAQMNSYGIGQPGKFTPFPPVTALVFVPLAALPPGLALQVWTVVNCILLIFCIILLSKITGKDWLWCSLLYLAGGLALINNFRFGQLYLLLSLLVLAGYILFQRGRPQTSGLLLGIGAALKYFPVAYLPLFALRREWKLIAVFTSTIAALYLLAAAVMGTAVYKHFFSVALTRPLGRQLGGNLQDPFSSTFQSWDSLFRRLFVADSRWNVAPVVDSHAGFYLCKYAVMLTILGLTVAGFRWAQKASGAEALQFALITVATLLILPDSATYHFLLLILPVGIVLKASRTRWGWEQKLLLACFVLIGFIPYGWFRPFDGRGLLTFLAYPRLGLMVVIFLTILLYVRAYVRDRGTPPVSAVP